MKGTMWDATRAMHRMPPMMTKPTATAIRMPNSQPLSAKKLSWPPVMTTNCTKAWFDWNMLPMPRQPITSDRA